jgi:hypothetical protein
MNVINKVGVYNAIPLDDLDYTHQLQVLRDAKRTTATYANEINSRGFMTKSGTLRGLGGPFRHPYYMLTRNLWKLAGRGENYEGALPREIELVKQQAGLLQEEESSNEEETTE